MTMAAGAELYGSCFLSSREWQSLLEWVKGCGAATVQGVPEEIEAFVRTNESNEMAQAAGVKENCHCCHDDEAFD